MPVICLFLGIRITMYYSDHAPPHFHAEYADYKCMVNILEGSVMSGSFPRKQLRILLGWTELRRDQLMQNWELARDNKELVSIAPIA